MTQTEDQHARGNDKENRITITIDGPIDVLDRLRSIPHVAEALHELINHGRTHGTVVVVQPLKQQIADFIPTTLQTR